MPLRRNSARSERCGRPSAGSVRRAAHHVGRGRLGTDAEASEHTSIAFELFALGGLAVRRERWQEFRELVLGGPAAQLKGESWLRQGQVASSRSATYREDDVTTLGVRRLRELDGTAGQDDALEAVCRFDLIAALIISESDVHGFYPNAAPFGESLVEPLVIEHVRDGASALREHVFPGEPVGLRNALREYDRKARVQAALMRRHGNDWRWRGWADARTLIFIDEGHLLEEWER